MTKANVAYALVLFFLAGLFEIGGCYLVFTAVRGAKPLWLGLLGGVLLALYGFISACQPAGFGRTYAAYGGVFVLMSLLWAWQADRIKPDKWDVLGAAVVGIGTGIIFFTPRK